MHTSAPCPGSSQPRRSRRCAWPWDPRSPCVHLYALAKIVVYHAGRVWRLGHSKLRGGRGIIRIDLRLARGVDHAESDAPADHSQGLALGRVVSAPPGRETGSATSLLARRLSRWLIGLV